MTRVVVFMLLFVFLQISSLAQNAVWQWSVNMPQSFNKKGEPRAYLWIPPACSSLSGLVLAQHNMEEISILESEEFRKAMADIDFGIIWINPMFDVSFNFTKGAGEQLNKALTDLAEKSGYNEIDTIPYLAIGHSAAASWPYYLAAWNPDRTICCISVSGQWPYVRNEWVAPDIWEDLNIDYIPCLETMGEYESANTWSNEGLKERQEHPLLPLSMLACPAEGHFATSLEKNEYIVSYIKKALQYRMPEGKLPLKKINPIETGWLVDKWRINEEPHASSASVSQYSGDKSQAFWFFDEEHAKLTEQYQSKYRYMKAPLLGVMVGEKLIRQKDTHMQVQLPFNPQGKDLGFDFQPVFLDTVPSESPRPSNWTGLIAGSYIEKPKNEENIYMEKVCGPYIIKDNRIKLQLDRTCYKSFESRHEATFAIKYPGDDAFKPAVQQGHFFISENNNEDEDQKIDFPVIQNVKHIKRNITLEAKSSKGFTVQYYIVSGPAKIKENTLIFTKIPPKSKFPIEVIIVAWQQVNLQEPKIKSTKQVVRTFHIENN